MRERTAAALWLDVASAFAAGWLLYGWNGGLASVLLMFVWRKP